MMRRLNENYTNLIKLADMMYDLYETFDPYWSSDDSEGYTEIVNLDIIKAVYPDMYDFIMENFEDIEISDLENLYWDLDDLGYEIGEDDKGRLSMISTVFFIVNNYGKEEIANYLIRPLLCETIDDTIDEMGIGYANKVQKFLDYAKSCGVVNKNETLEDISDRTTDW